MCNARKYKIQSLLAAILVSGWMFGPGTVAHAGNMFDGIFSSPAGRDGEGSSASNDKSPPTVMAKSSDKAASGTEAKSNPENSIVQRGSFQDWGIQCVVPSEKEKKEQCYLYHRLYVKETGQNVLSVSIGLMGQKNEWTMMAMLPLGFALGGGAAYQIDDSPQKTMTLITCTQEGCQAVTPADSALLDTLKKGKEVRFGVMSLLEQKTVVFPVSLKGFKEGLDALKSGKY